MPYNPARRRKPELTPHQKSMRFLTRLSVIIWALFALILFWFFNRPGLITH
jgi:hypothetical protein